MAGSTHVSTWVSADTKQRFTSAAARQGLSESALLKRLIEQMLATGAGGEAAPPAPVPVRDTRVTIRLVADDQALLRERAAARTMPAATYISSLVRAHLRQIAPLPDRELAALRATINELAALGRNLNTMTRLLHQDSRQPGPGREEVRLMLRICEALRDHVRALVKANVVSWEVGRHAG
ncbi:MAG: plasmid mobilization protein [Steroidobacteraceae bacterium]